MQRKSLDIDRLADIVLDQTDAHLFKLNRLESSEKKGARKQINITATTPAGAAKQLKRALETLFDARNVHVWSPEKSKSIRCLKAWTVCWEEGPFEWAIWLALRCSVFVGEHCNRQIPAEINLESDKWYVEPLNNYSLAFFKR